MEQIIPKLRQADIELGRRTFERSEDTDYHDSDREFFASLKPSNVDLPFIGESNEFGSADLLSVGSKIEVSTG